MNAPRPQPPPAPLSPRRRPPHRRPLAAALLLVAGWPAACGAIETVTFRDGDRTRTLSGRALARDASGGRLLQTPEGLLELIEGASVVASAEDDRPFTPLTFDDAQQRLEATLPSGFQVYRTPHYLVAYNTSRDYAKWTASMLERLHRAFVSYWNRRGFELTEPEFPLIVTIFADEASFRRAASEELGGGRGVVGYYSLRTNRVTMYDLTGAEQALGGGGRRSSLKEINRILATPGATPLVATVVHEATHQIAFNCGLLQRYADLPLWLVEGMAVYFEAPDLSSSRGWRGVGKVNYPRLATFRRNAPAWGAGTLRGVLTDSRRFRDPRTAGAAYADAWALNYYLLKHHPKAYAAYLQEQSAKPPLRETTPAEKTAEFQRHFGDLAKTQRAFLQQMRRVK